ncbi:hypothetical protein MRB53_028295 [Persea americana]|uniref:Uncharacterized protein n=1 Tax=Persea americana TaxID=3435 RepID=A0ACC2KF74_PERAE|nr:hypothetical protein MRB53_028295 [Persea americana]
MSCREREDGGGARWIRARGSGRCVQRGDMERDGSGAKAPREMKRLDGEVSAGMDGRDGQVLRRKGDQRTRVDPVSGMAAIEEEMILSLDQAHKQCDEADEDDDGDEDDEVDDGV